MAQGRGQLQLVQLLVMAVIAAVVLIGTFGFLALGDHRETKPGWNVRNTVLTVAIVAFFGALFLSA